MASGSEYEADSLGRLSASAAILKPVAQVVGALSPEKLRKFLDAIPR